jgi:REP element-mobilizing transposase RayT
MPDHAYLLVEGLAHDSDLRCFAKMAKQRSGGVYRRRWGQRLWQEGYYERVLRDEDDAFRSHATF